uniref:hypothetical protein n=1 Tax=Xanthomonas oryzae TaxID=347 RepID=UPI003DA038C1
LRPILMRSFKPAFLGRLKVVPYYPISDDVLAQIIALKLGRIRERVATNHKAAFPMGPEPGGGGVGARTEVDSVRATSTTF